VLIHWGVCAAWAEPLMEQPALRDAYRLLTYHAPASPAAARSKGRSRSPITPRTARR
jgi:hypothetical protein